MKSGKTTLQSLVDAYHRSVLERAKVKKACEELAGCEVELKDSATRKNWVQMIIKEGLEPLLKNAGDASFEVSGPFGLLNDLSISCKGGKYFEFRVRLPNGEDRGQFQFRSLSSPTSQYAKGTLGEINGGNVRFSYFPHCITVAHLVEFVRSRRAFRAFVKSCGTIQGLRDWKKQHV